VSEKRLVHLVHLVHSCQYLAEMALGAQDRTPRSSEVVRDPAADLSVAGGRPWGTSGSKWEQWTAWTAMDRNGPHPFANSEAVRDRRVAA